MAKISVLFIALERKNGQLVVVNDIQKFERVEDTTDLEFRLSSFFTYYI